MLVTLDSNRRNRNHAFALTGAAAVTSVVAAGSGIPFCSSSVFPHCSIGWSVADACGG
jgi:hypothetical protein